MKTLILFLSIFFLFADCKEEKPSEPQLNTSSIYGTWELVEWSYYHFTLDQIIWTKVSDGEIMVFYRNNSYYSSTASSGRDACPGSNPPISGRFRVINDCRDGRDCIEFDFFCNEDTYISKRTYRFEDNHLHLSAPGSCDEGGCVYKYKKIADPEGD